MAEHRSNDDLLLQFANDLQVCGLTTFMSTSLCKHTNEPTDALLARRSGMLKQQQVMLLLQRSSAALEGWRLASLQKRRKKCSSAFLNWCVPIKQQNSG